MAAQLHLPSLSFPLRQIEEGAKTPTHRTGPAGLVVGKLFKIPTFELQGKRELFREL